jgi:hypothetical protein
MALWVFALGVWLLFSLVGLLQCKTIFLLALEKAQLQN